MSSLKYTATSTRVCSTAEKADRKRHQIELGDDSAGKSIANLQHFFNIVQTAFDPPPLVLNMYVANFFERLFKKCVNACHDKIRQNNAYICGKNVASL